MSIDITTEPTASITAAAEFLGISRQSLHTWRKKGKLQDFRYGNTGRVCFKWSDLQALKTLKDKVGE